MKGKLLAAAIVLTCGTAWAQNTTNTTPNMPVLTKEIILQEVKKGCLQSGNTETACACSIKGFDEKLSAEEWGLLTTPPQQITQADVNAFKGIESKMAKVAQDCGANKLQ